MTKSDLDMETMESEVTGEGRDDEATTKLPVYVAGPTAVDITPKQDGGVMKEILREGTGVDHPLTGDKVHVHYVGTLTDGTKFDSSRDRGQLFEFNLGTGNVIKAWDIGVATMKKGELAVLLCKSEYAYGAGGSPPKIPANATLVFEVELFDWAGEDVSELKDGGVLRSVLHAGSGYGNPKESASCKIHLIGRHEGQVFEDRDVEFVLGEGSEVGIVDGVEQALKKFKQGETSRLRVLSKYAYGGAAGWSQATHNIPTDTDLEFEVKLEKFEKEKESWEMDMAEKIEQCEISKAKGTQFFKAGKFKIALRYYLKIVDYLKSEETLKEGEGEVRKSLQLAAHLNLAMCYLKLNNDIEASHSCDEALKLEPNNEKGLFRRATANLNLQNFELALSDFKAVLVIDPVNKAAKNQLLQTQHKIKIARDRERQTYAGMFTKFAAADAKKVVDEPEEKEGEGVTEGVTEGEMGGDEKNKEEEAAVSEVPLSTGGEDLSGSVIA